MSKTKRPKSRNLQLEGDDEKSLLGKMSRCLEILVRLNLEAMRGDRSQNDMISMLNSLGCAPSEIAGLLGTTANTVNVSLYKAKRKARKG